jgi:hypothetical protein
MDTNEREFPLILPRFLAAEDRETIQSWHERALIPDMIRVPSHSFAV